MGEKALRAAIVGLGWWGRRIVACLADAEAIHCVRGVDVDAAAASAFAAENGLLLSGDLQDALDDPAIDAVILATPHSLHAEQIVRAAAAGKHVFSEKPLALSRADAARAVAACAAAGVVLGVGHERRFEPAMIEIARLVESGALGTVMHAEADFSHDNLAALEAGNWRARAAEAPAAGMTGMGIHLTDAYIGMLGPVAEVHAQLARRVLDWEAGDVVSVQLRFASGATGYLSCVSVTPLYMRFQVFGSEAWVEARDTAHPETGGVTSLTLCKRGGTPRVRQLDPVNTVRANLEAFAAAALGGAPYPITTGQMVHNIATLEAICVSATAGAPVAVECGAPVPSGPEMI